MKLLILISIVLSILCSCDNPVEKENSRETETEMEREAITDLPSFISFEKEYQTAFPTLKYNYTDSSQTHNYSDNWDFDQDGINDKLYFIGTNGAHLYFFLKIILSTDQKPREIGFITSDMPVLTAIDTIDFDSSSYGFVVAEFGKNNVPSIIIRLDDQSFYGSEEIFKEKKITTKNVVINFENGKTKFQDFKET